MEFIAAKVAASSGDARKYLELVCLTIERCLSKLPAEKQDAELTKPVVTIRDAMLAIRETNVKYKDIIESLPFLDKVTLCTGVHLSRKLDSRPVNLRQLMHLTIECGGVEIDAGPEEFKESVERLSDSGLLTLDSCDKRSFSSSFIGMGLQNMPVKFDLQLEDVESALEEFIKSQSFFQRLVERVQAIQC
jgi:Cdc6-like AAA superfamily ATPase